MIVHTKNEQSGCEETLFVGYMEEKNKDIWMNTENQFLWDKYGECNEPIYII